MINENGIQIRLEENHDKPGKCKTFHNPVMRICREFVLCGLSTFCENQTGENNTKCLDAFGATGIGGMQWKRHLGNKVCVTINEMDANAVKDICENCKQNNLAAVCNSSTSQFWSNDPDECKAKHEPNTVEVVQSDANVIMHQRQFNFIHLDPYGTTVQFLDAAFRNVYNKGMIVVTSTDVAALYGKVPQVTMRNYAAYTLKCDYTKEMAARLVLAAVTRAAAKCNKGIHVLYCVAVEHFVQVAVKIRRGPGHADQCMTNLRKVLHCQMCEEWVIYPDSKAPIEKPYELLPCTCHQHNPGKTAVELGPVWCGELYDMEFVSGMLHHARTLDLSEKIRSTLQTMHTERQCMCGPACKPSHNNQSSVINDSSLPDEIGQISPPQKRLKTQPESSEAEGAQTFKARQTERSIAADNMPPFYYNLHRRKLKGMDLPKSDKFVPMLHRAGYRASRTHFEPQGIRTNATIRELTEVIRIRTDDQPPE